MIANKDIILFNGDSITDAGRDWANVYSLAGYTALVAEKLRERFPGITCFNRGISGDTSAMLLGRIGKEITELKPTVLTIMIGINDTWRRYDSDSPTSTAAYAENCRKIILAAAEAGVKKIVIIEPFLMPADPLKAIFREDLDPKIHALRVLAAKFKTEYIPLDGIFAELSILNGVAKYSPDGIHLTNAGNLIIAEQLILRLCKQQLRHEAGQKKQ